MFPILSIFSCCLYLVACALVSEQLHRGLQLIRDIIWVDNKIKICTNSTKSQINTVAEEGTFLCKIAIHTHKKNYLPVAHPSIPQLEQVMSFHVLKSPAGSMIPCPMCRHQTGSFATNLEAPWKSTPRSLDPLTGSMLNYPTNQVQDTIQKI